MQDRPPFVMHVVYNECCYVLRAGEGGKYMAQINVNNLTFAYEGSFDNVFENTSFSIDTNWRLGFVGRNGKGKTTFLNLLLGKYEYEGNISTNTIFDYFPYIVNSEELTKTAGELIESWKPGVEIWRVMCELPELSIDAELLYRPFGTLSFGERTKIMLAILFSGGNDFLLIDEPTNHLDKEAREIVKSYLKKKKYKDSDNNVFDGLSFEINNGDRVVIDGENGSGKSSLIKAILDMNRGIVKENANYEGEGILEVPENLVISYINQDTSHLKGFLKDYCELQGLDYTLFLSLLRQLDFERVQFVKPMEQYSEGQKKKVLIAASLLTSAHLYIWDEPLNYIDVFTRMQIEKLIETYRPTMLLVEHDVTFKEKIANKVIRL